MSLHKMAAASFLAILPWVCSSSVINPQNNLQDKCSARGLILHAASWSSVQDVAHTREMHIVGISLFAQQEVVVGAGRHPRKVAMVLNCLAISNFNISKRLDSFLDRGKWLLEVNSSLNPQGFYGEELSSEVEIADEQQNGSDALSTVTVREGTKMLREGTRGLWSVVIPTYNRLPILSKCLQALEEQRDYSLAGIQSYEVIVVDDGSTDGTVDFLKNGQENAAILTNCKQYETFEDYSLLRHSQRFPHVKLVQQKHGGATKARNLGLKHAKGAIIVFIDSDLVVTERFLKAHGEALRDAFQEDGDDRAFTYGRVVNTSNFHDPKSESVKLTDYSAAFFATGNVAISRKRLVEAGELLGSEADGPFDAEFSEYGWEDLELGVRLRQCGARIKHAPAAVGYHWHPAFSVEQLPRLIEQERQRGRNGVRFYRKHPTLNVRLMIQMTPFHEMLWFLLTLGGVVNEVSLKPILSRLVLAGRHRTAAALVSPILNWHTVQAVKEESRKNVR